MPQLPLDLLQAYCVGIYDDPDDDIQVFIVN